jgi:rod shape-determining protein MreC
MRRRNGRGRLLLLVFLALSILVITLDFRQGSGGPLERVKDVTAAIVSPIQRGFTAVFRPVGNFFSSLSNLSHLRTDNDRLENEVRDLQSEITRAEAVEEENARLREMLDLDEPWFTQDKVTAQVTSRVPSNYKWAVTIDKGESDGVQEDMAVIAAEGLVGKVVTTTSSTATVLLLIDPQGAASARIQEGFDTGLVNGNGGNEPLSLDLIGSGTEVPVGSKVVTSSYNHGIFPPDIPIGTVTKVGGDLREPTQQLEVEPYVKFTGLDFVEVLLETGDITIPQPDKGNEDVKGGG